MRKPRYTVYENPDNSEVTEEFDTLSEALKFRAQPEAEIIDNGVTMARARNGCWDLTPEGLRIECERFASGRWRMKLPEEAGTYSVAARDGELAGLRYLVSMQGKVFDPSNIKKTEGSEWGGWWWSEPHPELPNAPDGTKEVIEA